MYRCGKLTDVLIVYNIGTALQHIAAAKDAKLCISTWTLFCWSRKYNMDWNGARQILYPGPINCQGNLMKFIVISGTSCTKLHSIPVSSPSCARSQRVSIRNKFDCLISRDLQSSMHDQKGFLANTKLPCWTSDAYAVCRFSRPSILRVGPFCGVRWSETAPDQGRSFCTFLML